jgi:hypothetical protein
VAGQIRQNLERSRVGGSVTRPPQARQDRGRHSLGIHRLEAVAGYGYPVGGRPYQAPAGKRPSPTTPPTKRHPKGKWSRRSPPQARLARRETVTAEAHLCPECGELFPRGCMVLGADRRVVCLYCAIRVGLEGGIPTPETERGRLKLAYTTPKTREPRRGADGLLAVTPPRTPRKRRKPTPPRVVGLEPITDLPLPR